MKYLILIFLSFLINAQAKQKANIILIMTDDVGTECFSLYGGTEYKTPNLDALAKNGMYFTNAYSQPLCTPSRVQIMTGRYNNRNYHGFGWLDPKEITFANVLKKAGYKTCISGKWQLGGNAQTIKNFGFDQHCMWNMIKYLGRDKDGMANPKDFLNRYDNPTLFKNGQWISPGKDTFGPDICTDFIIEFINKQNDPFFIYYPMILPHSPFVPTPDSKERKQSRKQNFIDMTEYIDKLVGRIVEALKKSNKLKNTLIIFTSDNGTGKEIVSKTTQGRIQGGKASMINGGTHVPFIVHWPEKIKAGKTDELTDFSDILPTLAEVAGVKLSKNHNIDGKSLLALLKGETDKHRETIFCYYWDYGRNAQKAKAWVRNKRYKLYDDGSFYDLENDPLEKEKLQDGKLKELKLKLQEKLNTYMKK